MSRKLKSVGFRTLLAVGICALQGCASSASSPPHGEDLTVSLSVSGGIAGVDWQFSIDGRTGRITGDRCNPAIGCDWEPGQTLATVSSQSVRLLADEFQRNGFFEGETKFGSECCDQFDFRLAYGENDFDRTVTGSSGRLPQNILDLITVVQGFVDDARD